MVSQHLGVKTNMRHRNLTLNPDVNFQSNCSQKLTMKMMAKFQYKVYLLVKLKVLSTVLNLLTKKKKAISLIPEEKKYKE